MPTVAHQLPLFNFDKRCPRCGVTKPTADFSFNASTRDRLTSWCRSCNYAHVRAWREANPEKRRETARRNAASRRVRLADHFRELRLAQYRADPERFRADARSRYWADPERYRARSRQWRANNLERAIAADRAHKRAHADAYRANNRAWRAAHPKEAKAIALARRARKRAAPGRSSGQALRDRWAYYGGLCWMCGQPADTYDHVIALIRNGTNWPANIRPACRACNSKKHGRPWRDYAPAHPWHLPLQKP